jgi:hypothetical protein
MRPECAGALTEPGAASRNDCNFARELAHIRYLSLHEESNSELFLKIKTSVFQGCLITRTKMTVKQIASRADPAEFINCTELNRETLPFLAVFSRMYLISAGAKCIETVS